ncbi:MAG: pantetheine-phosphate adenylyltransferase [Nanoarchaeota archaeon]
MITAVYPGSFDPITNGHLDIIQRAAAIFGKVIIAVGKNEEKRPLFSLAERLALVKDATSGMPVTVLPINGLLADFMKNHQEKVIVRSLRAVSDFDYEFQLALMNRQLNHDLETLFLMTSKEWLFLSSSTVKELAREGAGVESLVPSCVAEALSEKFRVVRKNP